MRQQVRILAWLEGAPGFSYGVPDMTLFDSAWPDPCQLLKLEQLLCKHPLQLFKCFHALLLPVSKLVTTAPPPPPHPRTARPNRPPCTVPPVHPGQQT